MESLYIDIDRQIGDTLMIYIWGTIGDKIKMCQRINYLILNKLINSFKSINNTEG